jgi:perosamine synthetase
MSTSSPDDPALPAVLGGPAWRGSIDFSWPPADDRITNTLRQMAEDGSWGRYAGPHGEQLIESLRQVYGCDHVLLCSSGRAAIELALRGLSIADGDEVVMAAYDFHSNFGGIHQVGAMPVLCDVRREDAQLDAMRVDAALGNSTRCIIASHLHGGMVDMPTLRKLGDEHGVTVIEDACQASGAIVAGRPAGMWGDVGVLSFGGSKLLTAGRGGALLTNRADVMQRVRRYLRGDNHAYPLSEMQAAVLLPQVEQLPGRHQQRSKAVAAIDGALGHVDGLRRFAVPPTDASQAYYKVGLFYDTDAFEGLSREAFCLALRAEGLPVDPGLPALHTIHGPRRFRCAGELVTAEIAGHTIIGLHHPILLNTTIDWSELTAIVERIRNHAGQIAQSTFPQEDRTRPTSSG